MAKLTFSNFFKAKQKYYGLNGLDQKIEKYLNYDNGYYVELGANDGRSQSNTLYFERYRNWHGVLVEPTPHNYLLCRANRSPRNSIYCNACTSFEYKEKFVEIVYSNLMSTPIGLESDFVDPSSNAQAGAKFLKKTDNNFSFGAVAKPLNDLLVASSAPKEIDFLSLDVEGAEIEVLKGIDHKTFRFKHMCVESRDSGKLTAYLAKHGYQYTAQLSELDHFFSLSEV
jgi:FkbM family methyltransferase